MVTLELTRNDSRVKQIITTLKNQSPYKLRSFLNNNIMGRRLTLNEDKDSEIQREYYIEMFCKQKLSVWRQKMSIIPSRRSSGLGTPKSLCKICNEYYPALKREQHMKNCAERVKTKEEIENADQQFLNYFAEIDKEINEKSQTAGNILKAKLTYKSTMNQKSSINNGILLNRNMKKYKTIHNRISGYQITDFNEIQPRVLRKLTLELSLPIAQNSCTDLPKPEMANKIRGILQNLHKQSSPELPPIPLEPMIRKRKLADHLIKMLDHTPQNRTRQRLLSQFAPYDEEIINKDQNAQAPPEIEHEHHLKSEEAKKISKKQIVRTITPDVVNLKRLTLLEAEEKSKGQNKLFEYSKEIEVLKRLRNISKRAYGIGVGNDKNAMNKVNCLMSEIEQIDILSRDLSIEIKEWIKDLKQNCRNKIKLIDELIQIEKAVEQDKINSCTSFSEKNLEEFQPLENNDFSILRESDSYGTPPISKCSSEALFLNEEVESIDSKTSFLGSSKQLIMDQFFPAVFGADIPERYSSNSMPRSSFKKIPDKNLDSFVFFYRFYIIKKEKAKFTT